MFSFRKCKIKGASFSFFTLDPKLSAVYFDELLADNQAESGTGFAFSTFAVCILIKTEKIRDHILINSDTGIMDRDLNFMVGKEFGTNGNFTSYGCEFNGVGDQIAYG